MSLFFFLVFEFSYSVVGTKSSDKRESGHFSVQKAFGILHIKGSRGQRDMDTCTALVVLGLRLNSSTWSENIVR